MRIKPNKVANIFRIHKEYIDVNPETLWELLDDEIGINKDKKKEIPRVLKDMILAVRICFASDKPFTEWEVFENVILAMNQEIPDIDQAQEVFFSEIVAAVTVMRSISKTDWSDEVKAYMACVAKKDGFIAVPLGMVFIQSILDGLTRSTDEMRNSVIAEYAKQKTHGKATEIDYDNYASVGCGKLWDVEKYVNTVTGS